MCSSALVDGCRRWDPARATCEAGEQQWQPHGSANGARRRAAPGAAEASLRALQALFGPVCGGPVCGGPVCGGPVCGSNGGAKTSGATARAASEPSPKESLWPLLLLRRVRERGF